MASHKNETKKRKIHHPLDEETGQAKRFRENDDPESASSIPQVHTAGRIKKMVLRNFLCHDHLVMEFNKNVNFIVGRNGSGKSAILTAITVGLGGKASTTQRGDSYKSFIKNGKVSCTVEITLTNEGPKAYEPNVYGNVIKVIRTVSHSSSTVITKGQHDNTISRKKSDLVKIISALNIQVDNPISILNQKASKTFLIQPKPADLYDLFMKATQLETIGNNYKEAQQISKETQQKMEATKQELKNDKKAIDEIEGKIKAIDNLQSERVACEELQSEACWARVIAQEMLANKADKVLQDREKSLEDLVVSSTQNYNVRSEEINATIESLSEEIKQSETEASECEKARDTITKKYQGKREELAIKQREHKHSEKIIRQTLTQINDLNEEIRRLEEISGNAHDEKAEIEQRVSNGEENLCDIKAKMHTTLVDQAHVDSNKGRLEKEEREQRGEVFGKENILRALKQQLEGLSQQSGKAMGAYGRNAERLLKRIDEAVNMRQFKQRPRGPVGASIKIKDETWTPIIEKFLGSTVTSFCVDNSKDAQLLAQLIKEIYHGESGPEIICSKFIERVHDVRRNSTGTEKYSNIFDLMEISDPVIANCIIDQRSPESILLISTDDEAVALLQNIENVPRNCKYALTKKGDTYYPDPNFRTYAGRVHAPRYLQVSTTQVIQSLKKEIVGVEDDLNEARKKLSIARKNLSTSTRECAEKMTQITQLRSMQTKMLARVEEWRDQLKDKEDNADNRPHFIDLRAESEKKLEQQRIEEERLGDEVKVLQKQFKDIEAELMSCREKANGVDEVINPLKSQIRKLEQEKMQCQIQMKEADKKIINARHAVQAAVAEAEIQKRTLQTYLGEAEQRSRRIQTNRSEGRINELIKEKKHRILSVEKRCGSRDELQEQLDEKREKYGEVAETLNSLIATNEQHLLRVENRRKEYKDMRAEMGEKVETSFGVILAVRQYKGSLKIDYARKTLTLAVIPQNTTGRGTNETMTLSGGERSYTTVAFVLALWECTSLPFYFLDEFDVFMDKVNRRMIMEMLLLHTETHRQSQYGFFTPLDASIVKCSEFLTIHRLEAPERDEQPAA